MAAHTPHKEKDLGFKPEKLNALVEPLTVRVEKLKNNSRQPIELPPKENSSPGANWTRDELSGLETFLVTKWSGGGTYEIKVTDANGNTMVWTAAWPVSQFPERIPPNVEEAAVRSVPVPTPVPAPSTGNGGFSGFPMSAGSGVYVQPPTPIPAFNFGGFNQQQPQPQFNYPGGWQPWWSMNNGMPGFMNQFGGQDSSRDDRKGLEERLRQMEMEKMALQQKYELDRIQQQHAEQLRLLREESKPAGENEEVRRLKEMLEAQRLETERQKQQMIEREIASLKDLLLKQQSAPAVSTESEDLKRLREELALQKEEARREREKMERDREQDRLRQDMKEQREQFEKSMRELTAKQSDPVVDMMKEFMRAQQQSAINPLQIANLIKESSSGAHEFSRTVISQFGDIMGVMKTAIETAAQVAPGGNESFGEKMIEKALVKGSKVLDGFVQMKREETAAMSRAKENEARLAAAKLNTEAQLEAMKLHGGQAPQAPQALNGASPAPVAVKAPEEEKRTPTKEEEIFGQAYDSVQALRKGVASGGLDPQQVVDAVMKGMRVVKQHGLDILAFRLVEQERWADFVDILIPGVPQDFNYAVVSLLEQAVKAERVRVKTEGNDDDDDEDDDDDDEG